MTRANLHARRGGQAEPTEAVERLVAALGGREAVLGSASETITATGWRHHPGWGTDPGTPGWNPPARETLAELMLPAETATARPGR